MSGASDRRSVAVRIAGHDYKIRSDGDDEGLVRIAGYVDQAMSRVRDRTGTVDSLDVAVLTCLNLAREILALREPRSGAVSDDKLRGLIERVETAIGGLRRSDEASLTADAEAVASPVVEPRPRTLDLPSVETLRDRMSAPNASEGSAVHDVGPPVRVAAGGRDRVG
jgi:cell division protein ZapA (FtsZ GTPase activity inhibitor)